MGTDGHPMKIILLVLLLLLAALLAIVPRLSAQRLAHDVSVDSIMTLQSKSPIGVGIPERAHITNRGVSDEKNVAVVFLTRDNTGMVVFRDTSYVTTLLHGQSLDVGNVDLTPVRDGLFLFCANILFAADQNKANDTSCSSIFVTYEKDIQGFSITYPKPSDVISFATSFRPQAVFRNIGVADLFSVPVRLEIRRCSDRALVFRADTLVDLLYADSTPASILFPSAQANFDTKLIPPGCYQIAAISRQSGDGDRSNDTAYSTLTIFQDHDISADSVLGMPQHSILGTYVPTKARFTNHGNDEQNVAVCFTVYWQGEAQFRDTSYIASLKHGQSADVSFQYYMPLHLGSYSFCAEALLASDKDHGNDRVCAFFTEKVQHDMSADSILSPRSRITSGISYPIVVRFRNAGASDEGDIPAKVVITDSNKIVVYNESITIPTCKGGDTFDARYPDFIAHTQGSYKIAATLLLLNEQNFVNDTVVKPISSVVNNVEVLRIDFPKQGYTLPLGEGFIPVATFRNTGASEIDSNKAHLEIRSCQDARLFSRLDCDIPVLPADSVIVTAVFPSAQGLYNTKNLEPGCYRIAAFADGSSPADTAFCDFSIGARPLLTVSSDSTRFTLHLSPNPTNSATNVQLLLPEDMCVLLELFDMTGREVLSREFSKLSAGAETIPLDLEMLPNGRYHLRVRAGSNVLNMPLAVFR